MSSFWQYVDIARFETWKFAVKGPSYIYIYIPIPVSPFHTCTILSIICVFSEQCRASLGMQSGEIPNSAITASSSFNDDSVGPSNAR